MISAKGIGAAGALLEGVSSVSNLGFAISNMNYQKDLQKKIFAREDNSIQRRIADLKAAGLSPVLAAGQGAGTGATVPVGTPQISGLTNKLGAAYELATMQKNIERTDVDIKRTEEEINSLKLQQLRTIAETKGINVRTAQNYLDLQIQKDTGMTSSNTGVSGTIKNTFGVINKVMENQRSGKIGVKNDKKFQDSVTDFYNNLSPEDKQKIKNYNKRRGKP